MITPCGLADQTLVFQMIPLLGLLRAETPSTVTSLEDIWTVSENPLAKLNLRLGTEDHCTV